MRKTLPSLDLVIERAKHRIHDRIDGRSSYIHIESGGLPHNTYVSVDGVLLYGVVSIKFDDIVTTCELKVTLELIIPHIELVSKCSTVTLPLELYGDKK